MFLEVAALLSIITLCWAAACIRQGKLSNKSKSICSERTNIFVMEGSTLPLEDWEESTILEGATMSELEAERSDLEFEAQGIERSLSKIRLKKETMEAKKLEVELRIENLALREKLRSAQKQIVDWKKLHSDRVRRSNKDIQSQSSQQHRPVYPLPLDRYTADRELGPAAKDAQDATVDQWTRENGQKAAAKQIIPFGHKALAKQLKSLEVPNINQIHAMFDKAAGKVFYGHESQTSSSTTGDDSTSTSGSELER